MAGRSRGMGGGARGGGFLLAAVVSGGIGGTSPAHAQEENTRVLALVDYVTESEVYLAVGAEQGILVGDTLPAFRTDDMGAEPVGVLAIASANGRRSVAEFVGEPFSVSRGESLYLQISRALVESRVAVLRRAVEAEEAVAGPPNDAGNPTATPERQPDSDMQEEPGMPVSVHGRVSLDMDALQTTTRWGDSPEEQSDRTFSTPTLRFQARARDLPGGFRVSTSLRASHRTSTDEVVQPQTSVRFYQLDVEKRFETVPLQLHLGRFTNPFDDFGGYYDGIMVRVGGDGLGAGAAMGFEPELWNEGVSTDRPKITGFLDFSTRGQAARYAGALSFHTLRPRNHLLEETYVGFSQGLGIGKLWVRQRMRVDRLPASTEWNLTRMQIDATLPLSGSLTAHGGWRRWRPFAYLGSGNTASTHHRLNAGLSFWTLEGGASLDLSLDRPEVGETSRTVSSAFSLPRTDLLGLGFSGTVSYWTRGESSSLLLAPEVGHDLGSGHIGVGYRFYRMDSGFGETLHQFADVGLTLPLGRGMQARIRGSVQWGEDFSSNRILASLWKAF